MAMICTFGDVTDVTWWRELQLPTRALIGRDGRFSATTPDWIVTTAGRSAYAELAGKTAKQAQVRCVELLRESGELLGEPRPITHPVKFYERGSRPLEIVTSRQWYIRNGGRDPGLRARFLERGQDLRWYPEFMRHRYENWVGGLNGDWLISRQRFFGVPFPLWYRLDADGEIDHEHPIVPAEASLPIDPSSDVPPGYTADQRGQPGGFVGDPDVMDTWATSSLTPQIAGGWIDDPDLFARVFPMDMRPQAHDIIRTWLFGAVVRSDLEHGSLPWANATISGWILDPDRKKMSKSKGNVVTPMALLEQHGADAVRYWAAESRPGVDTAFDEGQMKIGRKLATKLLNVTKFVLSFADPGPSAADVVSEPLDRAMLTRLATVVEEATVSFEAFDYARALERTEAFFWWFCDDYVELVKSRAYGARGEAAARSALVALGTALNALQRLLAPIQPFVTDEVWSWWQSGSIHTSAWPTVGEVAPTPPGDPAVLDAVGEVLSQVRRKKTEAKVSRARRRRALEPGRAGRLPRRAGLRRGRSASRRWHRPARAARRGRAAGDRGASRSTDGVAPTVGRMRWWTRRGTTSGAGILVVVVLALAPAAGAQPPGEPPPESTTSSIPTTTGSQPPARPLRARPLPARPPRRRRPRGSSRPAAPPTPAPPPRPFPPWPPGPGSRRPVTTPTGTASTRRGCRGPLPAPASGAASSTPSTSSGSGSWRTTATSPTPT